jgi:hypothetical protein
LYGGHCVNFFGSKDIGAGDIVNEEDEDTDDNDEEDECADDDLYMKETDDPSKAN